VNRLLISCLLLVASFIGVQAGAERHTVPPESMATPNGGAGKAASTNGDSVRSDDNPKPIEDSALRSAAAKSLELVQQSQIVWRNKETCTSCHHQLLPELPLKLARERGLPIDGTAARQSTAAAFAFLKDLDGAVQRYDYIDSFFDGWSLVAAQFAGIKPSLSTAAYAEFLASKQLPDGSWPTTDTRPPQAYSRFTATAVCAQAVRTYLPERLTAEKEIRLRRARAWLAGNDPRTTEEKVFQVLGLEWTGANPDALNKAARRLMTEQREDGGWSQLPGLASDAYSTGEALFALRQAIDLPVSSKTYQHGLRFLLNTQQPDGSWHVDSRLHPPAPVSPPFFETGFPYKHDQFVSMMGTCWAASALLQALPSIRARRVPDSAIDVEPDPQPEWVNVALTGSATELRRRLDNGMSPNEKTSAGTTALMFAAHDPEKVKLLVERGADVNTRAATGVTPLMVAARYNGNVEVVRLLLKKGAKPNPEPGIEVANDAYPLFFAVMSGDANILRALLDAGGRLGDGMRVVGRFKVSPLLYAASAGATAIVERLIGGGANANEVDGDGISALAWAAISNRTEVARVLLAKGADVNHVDKFGMSPLLYAASIDFGDTAMLELLIASGADRRAKTKEGLTAIELAGNYHHGAMKRVLAGK